jgi:hypothetical protein
LIFATPRRFADARRHAAASPLPHFHRRLPPPRAERERCRRCALRAAPLMLRVRFARDAARLMPSAHRF